MLIQRSGTGSENYFVGIGWRINIVAPKPRFSLESKFMELEFSDRLPITSVTRTMSGHMTFLADCAIALAFSENNITPGCAPYVIH